MFSRKIMNGAIIWTMLIMGTSAFSLDKGATAKPAAAAKASDNSAANGSFEKWRDLTSMEKRVLIRSEKLTEKEQSIIDALQWPENWWVGFSGKQWRQGLLDTSITIDKNVKQDGNCALRIENKNHDISLVLCQRFDAEPDTRYQLKMWIKGENIDIYHPNGLILNIISSGKFEQDNNVWAKKLKIDTQYPAHRKKTFDWLEFTATFDTPAQTKSVVLILELRGAGILWIDDVRATKQEKITPVESL